MNVARQISVPFWVNQLVIRWTLLSVVQYARTITEEIVIHNFWCALSTRSWNG